MIDLVFKIIIILFNYSLLFRFKNARNIKKPTVFVQTYQIKRLQCLIHNGTLKSFFWWILLYWSFFSFKSDHFSMVSSIRNVQVTFVEKSQLNITSFLNYKHLYLVHDWWDKAFKGTVVNRTLHEESIKMTVTVPLNVKLLGF